MILNNVAFEIRAPDDDYLIALARANDAEVITSGDKDLLDWELERPRLWRPPSWSKVLAPNA